MGTCTISTGPFSIAICRLRLDNTHRPPFPKKSPPLLSWIPPTQRYCRSARSLGQRRPNDHGWKKSAKNEQQETTWKKMESSNLPNSFRNFQNTFLPNLDFYGRIQLSFLFRSSFAPTRWQGTPSVAVRPIRCWQLRRLQGLRLAVRIKAAQVVI